MKPTLETLPTELRMLIVSHVDDFKSLRSLALASPVYLETFKAVKYKVLLRELHKAYDGLVNITDAIVAIRCRKLCSYLPSNKEEIVALLDCRRRVEEIYRLGLPSASPPIDRPADSDEVVELLKLHGLAMIVLDDFRKKASCPRWIQDPEKRKWKTEALPLVLSKIERIRFIRAFYRLQIYGNLFGRPEMCEPPTSLQMTAYRRHMQYKDTWGVLEEVFPKKEAWTLLCGTMAPWETEEMGCVFAFLDDYDRATAPYTDIAKHLSQYTGWIDGSVPEEVQVNDIWDNMGRVFCYNFHRPRNPGQSRDLWYAQAWEFTFDKLCRGHPVDTQLLYPADRFNFGADANTKRLYRVVKTLTRSERPNLGFKLCEFKDLGRFNNTLYTEFFRGGMGMNYGGWWGSAHALWDDKRMHHWDAEWIFGL